MTYPKQFKDPIYGYISIDSKVVSGIIDTPAFQRLKDIRQTSYTPLFPAAYHNRYVHSLGVYHLGCIAFQAIKPQLQEKLKKAESRLDVEEIQRIFELACLLHDVGYAPFSHTGEKFFLDKANTLYEQLKDCVDDPMFSTNFEELGTKKPAAHECMSCVVSLKTFPKCFKSQLQRSLFARCIIGMEYLSHEKEPENSPQMKSEERKIATEKYKKYHAQREEYRLLNCVINLLNSSIIDVDRLDYIIRDAATIGFQNGQVDYMRLLNGMRIVEYEKSLCIGYHKSAISVIESAIYAHDAERKWIQGHPTILYEMEILKHSIEELTNCFASKIDPNPLFCYEALTEKGKCLSIPVPVFSELAKALYDQKKLWSTAAQELFEKGSLFEDDCCFDKNTGMIYQKYQISLLADSDILHLMKCFCKDQLSYEYFARGERRMAVWKSEAEFRTLFQKRIGDDSEAIKSLESEFEGLVNYCQEKTGCPIVDRHIFSVLQQEEDTAKLARDNKEIPDDMYNDIVNGIKTNRKWAKALEDISDKLGIEFEFLIIFQKKFNSSFKPTIGKIPILFPNVEDGIVPLADVIDVLKSNSDRKSNFFHLFYKPKTAIDAEQKKKIVNKIARMLIETINNH